jgi:transposase
MSRMYKRHNSVFKLKVALEAMKEQKTLGQLSQEYGVAPTQISTWKKHLEENARVVFEAKSEKNHKEEVDKLHRLIGQITAERDFLERALSR